MWEVRQYSGDPSCSQNCIRVNVLTFESAQITWVAITCPDSETPNSLPKKHPSLTPEGIILVGSLEDFQWKGNYIFWESLLGKARTTFVALRQTEHSKKLLECCVTPLFVPAPADIQISTQGSCTNSGYLALMENFRVLLGIVCEMHTSQSSMKTCHLFSWLKAVRQLFMPQCLQGALACKKQLAPCRGRRLLSATLCAMSFLWEVLPSSLRNKETRHKWEPPLSFLDCQ